MSRGEDLRDFAKRPKLVQTDSQQIGGTGVDEEKLKNGEAGLENQWGKEHLSHF